MGNRQTHHFTVLGQVPAKKNNRTAFMRNGRMMNFPNKTYMTWQADALQQLMVARAVPVSSYPTAAEFCFYMKDNRGRDLDNMAASVLDMLQKAEILDSDDWQHVRPVVLDSGGVDKENPRVEIFFYI